MESPGRRAAPITEVIGRRVLDLRTEARLSGAALAEQLSDYGIKWNRTTVIKLENGDRESVTVQELLALALVFDVPPVLLLADPRQPGPVPLTPDSSVDPWVALLWMIGSSRIDQRRSLTNFYTATRLVSAAWDISGAVRDLGTVERGMSESDYVDRNERRHRSALELLCAALVVARAEGATMPPLPDVVHRRALELDVDLPSWEV